MFIRFSKQIFSRNVLNLELVVRLNSVCPIACTHLLRSDNLWEINKRHKSYGRPKPWPNDWLPFKWERPQEVHGYLITGDEPSARTMPEFDPKKLQPIFENVEELKNAPDDVKKLFSVSFLPRRELLSVLVQEKQQQFKRHPFDTYSPETKVVFYTMRVRATQELLRYHYKDATLKRRLMRMVTKRKKWLNVLYRTDKKRYELVVNELNINNTPSPPGVLEVQRIERKKELRRLTREYCENIRNERLKKYHEELKAEQVKFVKEKEEAEQWIADTLKKFNLKDPRCGEIV